MALLPRLHSDEPTETDALRREHLTHEIADLAATASPPLVLGVHGDWGSGKTSFMKHVRKRLDGQHKKNVVTVWFEAWRYQNEAAPVVALLQEMRHEFSKSKKLKGRFAKHGEIAFRTLLNSLSDLAKLVQLESLPFSAEKIQLLGDQWEKEHLASQLVVDSLQKSLQDAIGILLPESKAPTPRVVVFIDDLDRCHPEMAYKLLEGLKIYLNLKNCVFVLAMNQQIVIKAIASAMKKDDDDARVRLEAEAYLEKLCANIWRLPPPDPVDFLSGLLHEPTPKLAIALASQMDYPKNGSWNVEKPFVLSNVEA
jgi:predicted KAP-like P-loop ATPase